MTSANIRKIFLDFFIRKGHKNVSSAPIVLKDDPTLMFTNAGMNQFKDIFLGNRKATDKRVVNTQKCLRVSGKHNDLEDVGFDTYHHTMFEMLGNWSFGDTALPAGGYFKQEAIEWAWELLTKEYNIDTDRLYVTIFGGSTEDSLEIDQETQNIWAKYISIDRILPFGKKDNFWEMGEVGPCGPCSEIHIDLRSETDRKKVDGKTLVNKGNPEVIEIWNLVFIQFNRLKDGHLKPLAQKYIDTGMGFERLVRVLQNKKSNYDTDIFQPIIQHIEKVTGVKYGSNEQTDIAIRVLTDHIRAVAFSIADGQLPSNTGAGYVIRRILRRAVRYSYQYLKYQEPILHELIAPLCQQMGGAFPEIKQQKELIEKVIKEEETSFLRTLGNGIKRLQDLCAELNKNKEKIVKGEDVFELYDTYGFPVDLTRLIAQQEYQLDIDEAGFEMEMEAQKKRAKSAGTQDISDWIILDKSDKVEFVGYDLLDVESNITKYRKVKSKGKDFYQLVLDQTPFYAESGGQVGDKGFLLLNDKKIEIMDTKKENDLIIHITSKLPEKIEVNKVKAHVDELSRQLIANNHSATHLLHAALKKVLGDHVQQKGSLVNDQYLRFDFSHFAKVTDEELQKIEDIVNEKIQANISLVEKRDVPIEEAKKMGATALFGEKYGDKVRVIIFDKDYSMELCGGTHVTSTGQIGVFKITSESAVAAGIRRIEAITGPEAIKFYNQQLDQVKELKSLLNYPADVVKSVKGLIDENTGLRKSLESFEKMAAMEEKNILKENVVDINGINFIGAQIQAGSVDIIKDISFQLKNEINDLFLIIGAEINNKALISVMISDNLIKEKGLHAGNIIKELSSLIQGGGGGQAFYATAGGKNTKGIVDCVDKAKAIIEKL